MSADAAEFSRVWDLVHPLEDRGSSVLVEQRAAEPGSEEQTTLFVASTDASDRAMDVVKQDWNLRNFRSNPVVLDNHKHLRVVGRATEAVVPRVGDDSGKLMIRVAWDLGSPDPSIAAVGHQHLNGFRSAGSVGFRHGKKTSRDKLPPDHPAFQQAQTIEIDSIFGSFEVEMAGWLFEKNELFEFSSATVPMNPEALQRSLLVELGRLEPSDVDGRLRVVRDTVPNAVGQDLSAWLREPAHRRSAIDLLWPDLLERVRTDPELRRILRAVLDAGPPAQPTPSFASLVMRHLEQT